MKSCLTTKGYYSTIPTVRSRVKAMLLLLIACCVFVPVFVQAQVNNDYDFTSTNVTYTEINGGTVHGTATNDDGSFSNIGIGFSFTFNGIVYNAISINSNGFIAMGSSISSSYTAISNSSSSASNNVIAGLNFDIKGAVAGTAELRSQLIGTAPSRVFVVQWKNYQPYDFSGAGDGDLFNFQIRLYETSNNVEVHYGSFTKNATARSAQVGLRGASNADFNNRSVVSGTHTWATSAAGTTNGAAAALSSTLVPTSGLVYKWTYDPPPQVFQSLTCEQIQEIPNRGSADTQILRIVVTTSGVSSPLSTSILTFNTNGSSNPSADIARAKVYYTGASNTFAATNQFGTAVTAPNGSFTVTGAQNLSSGNNYFWLVYDQSPTSTVGNLLDAELISATVGGVVRTPTISAPTGAVTIGYFAQMGTGTSTQRFPLGTLYGYERSASLYTGSEIGLIGKINSLSWQVLTAATVPTHARVYLKRTTDVTIAAIPWADQIQGATLVFDGTIQPIAGWWRVTGFNFDFLNSKENLYVLVETNYGGSGTSNAIAVAYSSVTSGLHRYWQKDTNPPTTETGSSSSSRPNLRLFITPPFTADVLGSTAFGNVGGVVRKTITLRNSSPLYPLTVSNIALSGDASSYKLYLPGTTTPVPSSFTLPYSASQDVDIVFGTQGMSGAGMRNMTVTLTHNGTNTPLAVPVSGYYASLTAQDGAVNLLAPGAKLDVGGVQPGPGQVTKEFKLAADVALPPSFPITITSYNLSGSDAAIFQVSTLPVGITGENVVSVTLRALGAEPGTKRATLTIYHSGANGPATTIELEGRIGQPVLGAPSLVALPPISVGQSYAGAYDNVALIPLTRAGVVDVQFLRTPTLTGSGAGLMELLSNGGMYFVRGVYNKQGEVAVVGNGDIADPANWLNPVLTPTVVTETQPLLLAVRMKSAAASTPLGSYDATLLLSDGSGNGVSNAVNVVSISVVGEVLNDPNILPFYPAQLTFGSTPIGTTQMRTLAIRNQSGVAGNVQLAITGTDYSFSNGGRSMSIALPANNSPVSVVVNFNPMSSGAANGVITVTGVMTGSIALSGTGQAANAGNLMLLVDGQPLTSTVDFGAVGIGYTGNRTVTIVNNNIGPVSVSSVGRSGANATQFAVGTLSTTEIAGNGGSATFDVKFMPTSLSNPQKNASVTIFNSTGIPKVFNVRGTASVENGNTMSVTLTPSMYNYGSQSGTHSFTLTNTGNSSIVVNGGIVLGSENFSLADNPATFPRTVGVGASTTLMVHFNSSQGVNGLRSASLLVLVGGVTPYPASSLTGIVGSGSYGDFGGISATTGSEPSDMLELVGSYPNPCSVTSELRYRLTSSSAVRITMYDVSGREVMSRDAGIQLAGEQRLEVEASTLQSGTYYYVIEASGSRAAGSLVVKK